MNYYLNNRRIEAPFGLDGLTLRRIRNPRYWGFLLAGFGQGSVGNQVRFREQTAIRELSHGLSAGGIDARTALRIDLSPGRQWETFVDYSSYGTDGDTVSVGLRDDPGAVSLEANATTDYALPAMQSVRLHTRPLGGLVQLLTDPAALTVQQSAASPVSITHAVPLTRRAESDDTVNGTLAPVVTPRALDPFYRNTTTSRQLLNLTGRLVVTAQASQAISTTLYFESVGSDGSITDQLALGQFAATPTGEAVRVIIDSRLFVAIGGSARLVWRSGTQVGQWAFTYDSTTALAVTDQDDVPPTTGYGIRVYDALAGLVSQASGGALQLIAPFFESGEGKDVLLLSGLGVRGIGGSLKTNLQFLFEGLNAIWPLTLDVDDGAVLMQLRSERPRRTSRLGNLLSVNRVVAKDYLYNQFQIGYTTWQGTGVLARQEIHTDYTLTSGVRTQRATLDRRSGLIAASTLIEEQRRKQFTAKTAGAGKIDDNDDKLFVVCSVPDSIYGYRAETTEFSRDTLGDYSPETLYNRRITPDQNLSRWLPYLTGLSALKRDTTLVATAPAGLPWLLTVRVQMDLYTYSLLGDFLILSTEHGELEGELLDIEWRKTQEGNVATITLLQYDNGGI